MESLSTYFPTMLSAAVLIMSRCTAILAHFNLFLAFLHLKRSIESLYSK